MKKHRKVGAVLLVLLAFVAFRVLFESHREFRKAERAEQQGKIEDAIVHYDRAAHWYLPGNPFVGRSLKALWNIGQASEGGKERLALAAYDSIRGSIHSIRHVVWPHKGWLGRVNPRIAILRAKEQVAGAPKMSYEAALRFHQDALALDERPHIAWVLLVELSFFAWVISVVGLIWRGFDREGRMHFKPAVPWIAPLVLSFAVWVVALLRA